MNIHDEDDRRGLRKTINEFESGPELQENTLICGAEIRKLGGAIKSLTGLGSSDSRESVFRQSDLPMFKLKVWQTCERHTVQLGTV